MKFQIGYFEEAYEGPKWRTLKTLRRATDTEAEAEIDSLLAATPRTLDGDKLHGLYIKRGNVRWFRRFSCHATR